MLPGLAAPTPPNWFRYAHEPPAPPVEIPLPPARFERTFDVSTFQKGNLHAHTRYSDGDSYPDRVYDWYRQNGYHFALVTDHHHVTPPASYRYLERPNFVMLPGEEVTMTGGGRQVHVNGLCIPHDIVGGRFSTTTKALTYAIRAIRNQGGIALINHPNFDWALTETDLPATQGASLIEIASGHPWVHSEGNETHLSHEALWDAALTMGLDVMGVAVDDMHHLRYNPFKPQARPGRAWVYVFATSADRDSLCHALDQGLLYASTGVSLKRIAITENEYRIWLLHPDDVTITFVGAGGRVLATKKPTETDGPVSYTLQGGEGYVRVKIEQPNGKAAWTPAVRVASS